jgi:hypothetical protein
MQRPLAQSAASSQLCPTAAVKQTPPAQWRPEPQSPSSMQLPPDLPLTQLPVVRVLETRQKPEAQFASVLHGSFSRPPLQRLPVQLPYSHWLSS